MRGTTQLRSWTSEMGRAAARGALALAMMLMATVVASRPLQAQTFTVLYAFTGGLDGGGPAAALARDGAGNLYGTTLNGGAFGWGTVFKVGTTGKETVLHAFAGYPNDGGFPWAGLVRDAAGNLYGTTVGGGPYGEGVVFKVDQRRRETLLDAFDGTDGHGPQAGLVRDAAGNLYGTTTYGGQGCGNDGCGVVFKLDKTGKETVLHSFTGTEGDGNFPYAGLIRDASGNLYGTTVEGGASNRGTAFKLEKSGTEVVLYSFTGGGDGGGPNAVIRDAAGNLYGTTGVGGSSDYGTVFRLDRAGNETVLYSFTGGSDGAFPMAGVVMDAQGDLYGTASGGGFSDCGCGVVFKVDQTGKETVLHAFTNGEDGEYPWGGLILDKAGNLYGTTEGGGAYGWGVVFRLTP